VLSVNSLIGFGGAGDLKSFVCTDTSADLTTQTTYTFAAQALGAAAADRLIVVAISISDCVSIDSVTIGGDAMTEVVQESQSADPPVTAIFQRAVAAGETADIVITASDAARGCVIGVFSMIGLQSHTAVDSDVDNGTDSTASVTLTTQAGDFVVASVATNPGERNFTWSGGVTKRIESQFGSGSDGSGSVASGTTTGSSITPLVTLSSAEDHAFVAAAWR
jgi:hypothetical protein